MAKPTGLLITGTDTGVGKSVVAAGLIRLLRERNIGAVGVKPLETGVAGIGSGRPVDLANAQPSDALLLQAAADHELDLAEVLVDAFAEPLAPLVAAERLGSTIDVDRIVAAVRAIGARSQALIVEGAGGIAVPIDRTHDFADLAAALNLAVLVVARAGLGTINHTLLTIRYARQRELPVVGFVINNYPADPGIAEQTNAQTIAELGGVPCLGIVPHAPDGVADAAAAANLCRDHLDIERIAAACHWPIDAGTV